MRAIRLELFNFCQHRHVVHDFGPGLTAVMGPNGSGKSNFIGGMKFALTGDIPSEGKKETNICQLADETESSFVSFRFQHGGFDPRQLVMEALEMAGNNKIQTAHILGISKSYLFKLIKQLTVPN